MPKYEDVNLIEGLIKFGKDTAHHVWDNYVNPWMISTRGYWDPYYAGYNPVRYDSPQYAFNQVMSSLSPVYGSLYRFGGNQAVMTQYGRNRDWNGIVQHPGSTGYGGYQDLGNAAWTISKNVTRLYR